MTTQIMPSGATVSYVNDEIATLKTYNQNHIGILEHKDQSFTNLLENGDFESWSAGASSVPDGWDLRNAPTIAQESTIKRFGAHSVKLTVTNNNQGIGCTVPNHVAMRDRIVTFGCWVYSSHANSSKIYIYDGVGGTFSSFVAAATTWTWITVSRTVNAVATELTARIYADQDDDAGFAYFDGAILVEGSVCPAFSPKPIVDDGVMLQNFTPATNTSDGKVGQWAYDTSYIYVCIATDTWKRVGLDLQGW